jgi:DNA-directed RNA polymerase subunit RPC12/RpoP
MSYIDTKYINLISIRLEKFSRKKDNLYNFRCPYCGDSAKNKNRARGFFFLMKSDMVYKCHNCGVGRSLANFLKDMDVTLHDEYVMERFKSGLTGRGSNTANPKMMEFKKPVFIKTPLSELQKISELNNSHPAKEYLLKRQIPEKYLSKFYYAEDFHAWAKTENSIKESRIVIPLMSKSGKLFGFQGRALDKNSKLRYITTILDDKYVKLFGLDTVDFDKTIYVTEGPFDSLFLSNAIAMCGSDIYLDKNIYKDRVFILDNEPRNVQIVNKYDKLIDAGEKVVVWPSIIKEKDINDMVIAGLNPQQIIEQNTFQGLEAKVQFTTWKKV